MFRGAIILALGYLAGYSHAASHNEQISKAVQDIKRAWAEGAEPTSGETNLQESDADE